MAVINGTPRPDLLTGTTHDDLIEGLAGDDIIRGGGGNDTLVGGGGNDLLLGGDGRDRAVYSGSFFDYDLAAIGPVVAVRDDNPADADEGTDLLLSVEELSFADANAGATLVHGSQGTAGNDLYIGTAFGDTFNGGAGDDLISGNGGNDTLAGGAGNDLITGGAGNDTINAGAGNDTIFQRQGDGADTITGGAGHDVYRFASDAPGVALDITASSVSPYIRFGANGVVSRITGVEDLELELDGNAGASVSISGDFSSTGLAANTIRIRGTNGPDVIDASGMQTSQRLIVNARGGDDVVTGGPGNDILNGGAGNDTLRGGLGNDTLNGGPGNDRYLVGDGGADTIANLSPGDTIQIQARGFESYASVLAVAQQVGGNTVITFGPGNTLTLVGVPLGSLTPQTFGFPDDVTASLPALTVLTAQGDEDTAIALNISAALTDTDGSESLSILIENVPAGATLSAGVDQGGGVWLLTPRELAEVAITPAANSDADFTLTVRAVATESSSGATAETSATLQVQVNAVPDAAPDVVLTNAAPGTTFAIPEWALLLNDQDLGSTFALQVSTVDNASGGTLGPFNSTITILDQVQFTDSTPAGGSFTYTATNGAAVASASVAVSSVFGVVSGGAADEILLGTSASDTLAGGAGNDILIGNDGADTYLVGPGGGFDTYFDNGYLGTDRIVATADGTAIMLRTPFNPYGGLFSFTAVTGIEEIDAGGRSGVTIQGSDGRDVLDFRFTTLTGIASINGGGGDDVINGARSFENTIDGGAGNDLLGGSDRADTLRGGDGVDYLWGDAGNDTLDGGADGDTAFFAGSIQDYEVVVQDAAQGRATVRGAEGVDQLVNIETIAFDDYTLRLDGGNNAVIARDDTVTAMEGVPTVLPRLLENDVDFDRDPLTIVSVGNAQNGTIVLDANGNPVFTAASAGPASFEYTVSDGRGSTSTATVSVNVVPVTNESDDVVLTNAAPGSAIVLPEWALTRNDAEIGGTMFGNISSLEGASGVTLGAFVPTGSPSDEVRFTVDAPAGGSFSYTATNGVISATARVSVTSLAGALINGGAGDENLVGSASADTLLGNGGDDVLLAGEGDDLLVGGTGNDYLDGGQGSDDYLFGTGDGIDGFRDSGGDGDTDRLLATGDNVAIALQGSPLGFIYFSQLARIEEISANGFSGVTIQLGAGNDRLGFLGTTLTGIEGIDAGDGDDIVGGTAGADTILGGRGNDYVSGDDGDDTLRGGDGNDTLVGDSSNQIGTGNDAIDGGAGFDTAVFAGNIEDFAITVIDAAQGRSTVTDLRPDPYGDDGTDQLVNVEALQFSNYTVYLDGRNNAASARNDSVTAMEDVPTVLPRLLENDVDYDRDPLTIVGVGNAQNGTIVLDANGNPVFTAASVGPASFEYTVSDGRGSTSTATVSVDVVPENLASAPTLSTQSAQGAEDTAIPLSIAAALTDTDGSEALTIRIEGVPPGATLSAGTNQGNGVWTLTPAQLEGLTLTPPANSDADFTLTVRATATESNGGATAETSAALAVTVEPVDDPLVFLTPQFGAIREGATWIWNATAVDVDTTGPITYSISGELDAARFTIDANTGAFRFAAAPDFENPADDPADLNPNFYRVEITATNGASTVTQTVAITVVDSYLADSVGAVGLTLDGAASGDRAGGSVAGGFDVNGDGFADVIVGAPFALPSAGQNSGQGYVVFGSAGGSAVPVNLGTLPAAAGFRLDAPQPGAMLGTSVSGAGDFNNDGYDDLLIGAPGSNAAFIVLGRPNFATAPDLANPDGTSVVRIEGAGFFNNNGMAVANAGDVNGDGIDDIITGNNLEDVNGGAAYVVYGRDGALPATLGLGGLLPEDGFRIAGGAARDYLGGAVASAGDFNGDGYGDVVIGAPGNVPGDPLTDGDAYVLFGGPGNTMASTAARGVANLTGADGFRITGVLAEDGAGTSVGTAGDINGDGFDDLVIGAPSAARNGISSGEAYVVFGTAAAVAPVLALSGLDGTNGFRIIDSTFAGSLGVSVSSAGDFNADGIDDLIVGVSGAGLNGSSAYVVYGSAGVFGNTLDLAAIAADPSSTAGLQLSGVQWFDSTGSSVSAAGDVNGDGFDDVIVGAPNAVYDQSIGGPGAAGRGYVVYGGARGEGAYVLGDAGDNALAGTGGDEILVGGLGNDTLDGGGGDDVLNGGAGNDRFVVNFNDGLEQVRGGSGIDTLTVVPGTNLALTLLDDDLITGIERIDIANGSSINDAETLQLSYLEVLALTDGRGEYGATHELTVNADLVDQIDIGAGWTLVDLQQVGDETFSTYTQGLATLYVNRLDVGS